MREAIQMNNARELVQTYTGIQPLVQHLKNYYRTHHNIGSRDRKILNDLVFGYYRQKGNRPDDDKYFVAAAKESTRCEPFYAFWKNELKLSDESFSFDGYFPCADNISSQIDQITFLNSHLHQPSVWIRCKQEFIQSVLQELDLVQYKYERNGDLIKFSELYPLQELRSFSAGYFELQDIASQQTGKLFQPKKNEAWWDCCAGSGGKSLLLLEQEKQIQLFVSDNRESIIQNLSERFHRSGVINYNAYVADLTQLEGDDLSALPDFNGIIADVPCSGSGTWSRTPEWLTFFTREKMDHYIQLQREIIKSVTPKLLPGGRLIYITCSVFKDENENNIQYFLENLPLQLEEQQYFQYSSEGGDTLFGAVLIKKS